MTGFGKVLRNSGYLLGFRLLSRILSTVFLVFAASRLAPASFGALSFTLVTLELVVTLGDLGITRYGARELVRLWDDRAVLTGRILLLQIVTSMLAVLAGLVMILGLYPAGEKQQLLLLAAASFFFYSMINTSESVFIASERFFFSALLTFIGRLTYMSIGFVVLVSSGSIVLIMWGFLFAVMLEASLRTVVAHRITGISMDLFQARLWEMLRHCIPFAVAGAASIIMYRGNVVVLELFRGDAEVGVFNAAFSLFTPFAWLVVVLNTTIFPGFTAVFAADRQTARSLSMTWYRLLLLLSIPIAVAVTLLAGTAAGFFPEGYENVQPALIILVWSLPTAMIMAIDFNILQVTDRESTAASGIVLSAIVSMALSLLLIPYLGDKGAALALLGAYFFGAAFLNLMVRREFSEKGLVGTVIRPVLAGAVMGISGYFLMGKSAWLAAAVGLVVYAASALALGAVRPAEIRNLLRGRTGGNADSA